MGSAGTGRLTILTMGLIAYIMFLFPVLVMLDNTRKLQSLSEENGKAQSVLLAHSVTMQENADQLQRILEAVNQSILNNELAIDANKALTINNGNERRAQMIEIFNRISASDVQQVAEYKEILRQILIRTAQRVTRHELNVWTEQLNKLFPDKLIPKMPHIDAPVDQVETSPVWNPLHSVIAPIRP